MIYFCNPTGPAAQLQRDGLLGFIDTPNQGNKRPGGVTWCADNGAFSDKFDEVKWWRFLTANAHAAADCKFAVAPDVVGDAQATIARSRPWLLKIRYLGYPVAFVAQDGLTMFGGALCAGELGERQAVHWAEFDALFIGGTDTFKLGATARGIAAEAKKRGKWVHMGRVNSEKRFQYARHIGCDSVDGTFLKFGPNTNLPRLRTWLRTLDQLTLEEA